MMSFPPRLYLDAFEYCPKLQTVELLHFKGRNQSKITLPSSQLTRFVGMYHGEALFHFLRHASALESCRLTTPLGMNGPQNLTHFPRAILPKLTTLHLVGDIRFLDYLTLPALRSFTKDYRIYDLNFSSTFRQMPTLISLSIKNYPVSVEDSPEDLITQLTPTPDGPQLLPLLEKFTISFSRGCLADANVQNRIVHMVEMRCGMKPPLLPDALSITCLESECKRFW